MATYAPSTSSETSTSLFVCSQSADTTEPVFFDLVDLESEELTRSYQLPEWSLCQSIRVLDESTAFVLTLRADMTFILTKASFKEGSFAFKESKKPLNAFFDS